MTPSGGDVRNRRGFRGDIQGLRAVAVGLVLVYHAGIPFVTGGYVGVDVFFVISGFLISSHLLESLERNGRINFADFYARRIRRILPASLVVAVLTAIAAIAFYPPLGLERILRDGLATILYVPNIWFAIQNTDYLADHSPSPYQHYWSLGVEEQFYLLWPLVLLLLFLLVRRRRVLVIAGISLIALASLVAGVLLTPLDQPAAFFLLPTRAWELLAGALIGALLLHRSLWIPAWVGAIGGWVGVALILVAAFFFDDQTAFPGTAAIVPTLGTALVIFFGATSPSGGPTWMLSIRPMQFVGLISYSLYLVHWPLLVVTQAAVGEQNPLRLVVRVLMGIVIAVPLAWLLFRFVETPMRAPHALTRRRPRVTLFATLGVTVLLSGALLGAAQWASVRDVGTGGVVAEAPEYPAAPPHATGFVPRNMTPSLAEAADDLPAVYADGCHHEANEESVQDCAYGNLDGASTIAVFGDSHSAQWFPAVQEFAEANGNVAIDVFTKSSCPAVSVTVVNKDVPYLSCDRWREAVLERLEADPPEVVVISNYAYYDLAGAAGKQQRSDGWATGLSDTVTRLEAAGSEVLVLADTPRFDSTPTTCVSANVMDVTQCAGARVDVIDEARSALERTTVEGAGGDFLELTDYICDQSSCPVIIDDLLVYRDVNHLTTAFVRYLAPALTDPLAMLLGR